MEQQYTEKDTERLTRKAGDMDKIEVVTYDLGTGCNQTDLEWDVRGLSDSVTAILMRIAARAAVMFAEQDCSTDHVVYVRNS